MMGQARPSTLTAGEAAKAARARYNSPLDPEYARDPEGKTHISESAGGESGNNE